MTADEQRRWGSHLPVLAACVALTEGPVLELGVGWFSTPLLHALCGLKERLLISVESDQEWIRKLPPYHCGWHRMVHSGYDEFSALPPGELSVVFIDNSPGGERRRRDFERYLPLARFVVVHDYHRENEEAIRPLLAGVAHRVFDPAGVPTLLASRENFPHELRHLK